MTAGGLYGINDGLGPMKGEMLRAAGGDTMLSAEQSNNLITQAVAQSSQDFGKLNESFNAMNAKFDMLIAINTAQNKNQKAAPTLSQWQELDERPVLNELEKIFHTNRCNKQSRRWLQCYGRAFCYNGVGLHVPIIQFLRCPRRFHPIMLNAMDSTTQWTWIQR